MPQQPEHIEIRSDEVQEIMSHVPNWMVRWGITLIFGLILMLVLISWFVKYPDVIQGGVTISTAEPPVKLVAKVSGELEQLYIEDGISVRKGDLIAGIGTTLTDESKTYLLSITDSVSSALDSRQISNITFNDQGLLFGGLQTIYNELKKGVLDYQYFLANDNLYFELKNLSSQIKNHQQLKEVSYQQLNTAKKELANAKIQYESDKKLYEKKVISKTALFEKEKSLIQAENNVGNYKKSAVQTSITIADLEKQKNTLQLQQREKENNYLTVIKTNLASLRNQLSEWGKNYRFIAPKSGKLTYLEKIDKYQNIAAGASLFAIIPESDAYIGYIDVPKVGSGKLKIGQNVKIKVDKYPSHEFGQLEGTVTHITPLANKENFYRVSLNLTNGMESTYHKKFEYSPEMSGTADIITEDVRLLERVFNKLRKVFD